MYADDVMLIFNCCPHQAMHQQLHRSLPVFEQFAHYTGLQVNFAKLYLIPKGEWTPEQKLLLTRRGMRFKDSAKCLDVKLGEVTPQQAVVPSVQKAMLRALAMQHWDITLAQPLALLELRILPLLSLPARVVFPDKAVIASLHSVYHTALRIAHYGITLSILM